MARNKQVQVRDREVYDSLVNLKLFGNSTLLMKKNSRVMRLFNNINKESKVVDVKIVKGKLYLKLVNSSNFDVYLR